MKKPRFVPIFLAVFVLLLFILCPNNWIKSFIPKERVETAATELNPLMFQGTYIQDKMLKDDRYLPIYGSSELSRLDRFHPSNYFTVNHHGFTPFLVGRGGSQSLIHFVNFAAHTDQLKGKKLVFVLSPQWFIKKGSDETHFAPNFSDLQGYDLAFNTTINPVLKKKAMARLLHFDCVKNDAMLSILYKAETSNDPWIKKEASIVRPFARFYKHSLDQKDLYYSLAGVGVPHKREISPEIKDKTWAQLEQQAADIGKQHGDNQFHVIDSYYKKLEKKIPKLKGFKKGATFGESVEYYDLQLVLDVLKDSGAKPLFVIAPVNGKWYDYMGFPKEGRTAYYTKVKKQVEAKGFQVADFSNHEYDPYFMKDTIHMGWKGWVYVDKEIQQFYAVK
jgi:D-alanine transfer protein